ncbi:MAG: hypothetical protein AB7V42_04020 [Thermoleophilia bacterium]
MFSALLAVAALAALAAAVAAWRAAVTARQAVVMMRGEREREHWSRLARGAAAVERAASAYQWAMARPSGSDADRHRAVVAAAVRYQEASTAFAAALGGGPRPSAAEPWLAILTDGARPEDVVSSGAASQVIAAVAAAQAEAEQPPPVRSAAARLARARSTVRLARLGRLGR